MRGRRQQLGTMLAESTVWLQQFGTLHLHQTEQGKATLHVSFIARIGPTVHYPISVS